MSARLRCAIGLHAWEFEPRHHRMAWGEAVGRQCTCCGKRQRWLPSPHSMQRGWVDDWLPRPKVAQTTPPPIPTQETA